MTLLLLAGIVVLAAVQLATVVYNVKLGVEETKEALITSELLMVLVMVIVLRFESVWMQSGTVVANLLVLYISEVYKGKAHGDGLAVAKKKLPMLILGSLLVCGAYFLLERIF